MVLRQADQTADVSTEADADFAAVPAADESAVPDPLLSHLRGSNAMPLSYLPPAMAGRRPQWIRAIALILVGVFITATAAGVCLTYGPRWLGP